MADLYKKKQKVEDKMRYIYMMEYSSAVKKWLHELCRNEWKSKNIILGEVTQAGPESPIWHVFTYKWIIAIR